MFIHTHVYIHNLFITPLSQDCDLASHTTYIVCVNFIHKWRDLQFKVVSERQIFEKLFHGNLIYSQASCQKSSIRQESMVQTPV